MSERRREADGVYLALWAPAVTRRQVGSRAFDDHFQKCSYRGVGPCHPDDFLDGFEAGWEAGRAAAPATTAEGEESDG